METNRRGFLQVAGLALLGVVAAKPAMDLFSSLNSNTAEADSAALDANGIATPESQTTRRLGISIDVKKCNDYKKAHDNKCNLCEVACHTWHKVPDMARLGDAEEEIKWIWEDSYGKVFEENLVPHIDEEDENKKGLLLKLLCNHCNNPPCIKYCPTRATFKRADGIIIVDEHRCIGCRYCMAGCPYGARSFNWGRPRDYITNPWRDPEPVGVLDDKNLASLDYPNRTRGVVEKCNFCADILEIDEGGNPTPGHTPKCVEACPSKALTFGDLLYEESEISKLLKARNILRRLPELGTNPNNYYILE